MGDAMKRAIAIGSGVVAAGVLATYLACTPKETPDAARRTATVATDTHATTATSTGATEGAPTPLNPTTKAPAAQSRSEASSSATSGETAASATGARPTSAASKPERATAPAPSGSLKSRTVNQSLSAMTTTSYRYSMTDPNAGPEEAISATGVSTTTATGATTSGAVPGSAASASVRKSLSVGTLNAETASSGSVLSPDDQSDLNTANAWWAAILRDHPDVAMSYAWIQNAGWRYRDWVNNGCTPSPCTFVDGVLQGVRVPPTDYFGAQGLDSPLGKCHDLIAFPKTGLLDATTRGVVCVLGKYCVVATIDTPRCPRGVCSAHFDRPCGLLNADEVAQWIGGDVHDPKLLEQWGMTP